jgi:hypothetical protein
MKFVIATLYVCLTSGGGCEQKQIRIQAPCVSEQKLAQVPVNGEWQNARVGVKCS